MKIALVQPFIDDGNIMPCLGLLYIGAVLEKSGFEVKIFDEKLDRNAESKVLKFEPDLVGVSVVTPAVNRGLEFLRTIKDKKPAMVTVMGGPHATIMPEDLIKNDFVDFVIVSEGEYPMLGLCKIILRGDYGHLSTINNLIYKENEKIRKNKVAEFLSSVELDKLPLPAFHLMDIRHVFGKQRHGLFQKGKRALPVMSSRGCPNQCTFCCRIMGSKFRMRSPEKVVEEVKYLVTTYDLDEIFFEDDNFTINRERALRILDGIKDLGIYIKFANGIRADCVDYELLAKMKDAGCYSISFGIESGCEHTLQLMKKHLSLDKVKESISLAKSLGFLVGGNCIIGYPDETPADIEESLRFFESLRLDSMAIVNLVPFPGTEVRRICEEKGYLTKDAANWDNYLFGIYNTIPLIETEDFKAEDIARIIKKGYRRFYFKPGNMVTIIANTSPKEILDILKSFVKRR